jgi:thioredoxin 1
MAEHLAYLNDDNFENEISKGVTLVDFYADWCGPCRMMTPIMEDLAEEMQGKAKIAKLDIEKAQRVASSFNVTSIPTIVLFKDGSEIDRVVGVRDKDFLKKILLKAM